MMTIHPRGLAVDPIEVDCVADGTTDDSTPFLDAINLARTNVSGEDIMPKVICPPNRKFLINDLTIPGDIEIDLNGSELISAVDGNDDSSNIMHVLGGSKPVRGATSNDMHNETEPGYRIILRNGVINGGATTDSSTNGGEPLLFFYGCEVELHDIKVVRAGNFGTQAHETEILDYRNQAVLLYNCDVKIRNLIVNNCPTDDVTIQSSDGSHKFDIDDTRFYKHRNTVAYAVGDSNTLFTNTPLVIYNMSRHSLSRNIYVQETRKSALNLITKGTFDGIYVESVLDSSAIDCNEAAIGGYGNLVIRNWRVDKSLGSGGGNTGIGVRATGSNIVIEDGEIGANCAVGVAIEQDITVNSALPDLPQADIEAYGVYVRRIAAPDGINAGTNYIVQVTGTSTIPARVFISDIGGGKAVDEAPTNKTEYAVYGTHAIIYYSGGLNQGRTAMIYITGAGSNCYLRDAVISPEVGETTHVVQVHDVSDGPTIIFDNCERITALDASYYDVVWSGTTADMECHRNNSPTIDTIETPTAVRNYINGRMRLEWNGSIPGLADGGTWSPTTTSVPVNSGEDEVISVKQDLSQSTLDVIVDARVTADNTITIYVLNHSGATISNPTSIYLDIEIAKDGYVN
jgi:hypothetical protein